MATLDVCYQDELLSVEPNAKASQKQGGEAFDAESCGSLMKKKVSLTFFFYPNQLHCLNNYLSLDRSVSN